MPDSQPNPDSQAQRANPAEPDAEASLVDDVFKTLRSLSRLRIVTAIGKSDLSKSDAARSDAVVKDGAQTIVTQIDLVAGDLTTVIDPALADDPDHPVAALHRQNVETARAQVAGNVELALDVLDRLTRAVQNRDAAISALNGGRAAGRRDGG